jgi:hypothetical protein
MSHLAPNEFTDCNRTPLSSCRTTNASGRASLVCVDGPVLGDTADVEPSCLFCCLELLGVVTQENLYGCSFAATGASTCALVIVMG